MEPTPSVRVPAPPRDRSHTETPPTRQEQAIESVGLAVVLDHLATRIGSLEAQLAKRTEGGRRDTGVEVLKALSGWPTFGLLFLLLFYVPLRDAIGAIPDKVKQAEQIEVLGVSLKSSLRVEAQRIGAVTLSETLPALSPRALELLLRGGREREESLLSYSIDDRRITRVWLPSAQMIDVLGELEQKGLVTVIVRHASLDGTGIQAMKDAIAAFRQKWPGRERSGADSSRIEWELNQAAGLDPPYFAWRLTELGKKGVEVILSAVSSQLTAQAANEQR